MTAAKCRERVRAAGTTSGTAEKKQPHRHSQEPGISQVTPATEERGCGSLLTLWMLGARALENGLRLECFRDIALLLPMLSMHLSETHREMQDIRHQQSDNTYSQRRRDSSAQMVKTEEIDLQSYCPSAVSVHVGTAYLSFRRHSFATARFTSGCHRDQDNTRLARELKYRLGHCHLLNFSKREQ